MSSTMTTHLERSRGPNAHISSIIRQAGIRSRSTENASKDVPYVDLCDDSDDEDTIIVQQRVKAPLSQTSWNNSSNLRANSNLDQPRLHKRPASTLGPAITQPLPKKSRHATRDHGTSAHAYACLSPPRSPPPVSSVSNAILTRPISKDIPHPKPQSSSRPVKKIGPFVVDSDSDTDDEPPQKSTSITAQVQLREKPAPKPNPSAEMTPIEKQKWWQQLRALAKTNPGLTQRLIMQRKARLQNNAQFEVSGSAMITDSKPVIGETVRAESGSHKAYEMDIPATSTSIPGDARRLTSPIKETGMTWKTPTVGRTDEKPDIKPLQEPRYKTATVVSNPEVASTTSSIPDITRHGNRPRVGQENSSPNILESSPALGLHRSVTSTVKAAVLGPLSPLRDSTFVYRDLIDTWSTTPHAVRNLEGISAAKERQDGAHDRASETIITGESGTGQRLSYQEKHNLPEKYNLADKHSLADKYNLSEKQGMLTRVELAQPKEDVLFTVQHLDEGSSASQRPKQNVAPVLTPRDSRLRHHHDIEDRHRLLAGTTAKLGSDQAASTRTPQAPIAPTSFQRIPGGFSENSINGQVQLGQCPVSSKPNPFQSQPKVLQPRAKTPGEARGRQPGKSTSKKIFEEITSGDVKLYKRKEGSMMWRDLIAYYTHDTGQTPTEKQLRKRWQNMSKAIDECGLDQDLIAQAALGDAGALNELNRIIRERNGNRCAIPSVKGRTGAAALPEPHRKCETVNAEPRPEVAPDMRMLSLSSPIWPTQPCEHRPVYGGKTMSLEAQMAYLEALREEDLSFDDDITKTEEIEEHDDDLTDEDYQQFVYWIVRREWTAQDSDDEYETIEDKPWLECGTSFSSLCNANKAVATDVLKARPGAANIADPDVEFRMQYRKDPADGTLHITLSSHVGAVESRVERRIRDSSIRTLPQSSSDLAPRRTYFILQRETASHPTDDNLLDAPSRTESTRPLDLTAHTTLSGANKHAIDHWLKATFRPTSRNLNMRELEIEARRDALLIEFDVDGDEGRPFRKAVRAEDETEYEVWVEEGRLAGPRNL